MPENSSVSHMRSIDPNPAWIVAGLFAAVMSCFALISGPATYAEHARQVEIEIQQESRKFCETLGLVSDASLRERCVRELEAVRAHQKERAIAEAQGLL